MLPVRFENFFADMVADPDEKDICVAHHLAQANFVTICDNKSAPCCIFMHYHQESLMQ